MKSNGNFNIEIAEKDDNEKAVVLFNKFYYFCTGENRYTSDSVLAEWNQPRFSLTDDVRVAIDNKGNWIAYVAVLNTESPYSESIIEYRIDPH